MHIYDLRADLKRYPTFAVKGGAPKDFFSSFDGRSMVTGWTPVAIEPADENPDTVAAPDFALLGVVPLFSDNAVRILESALRSSGELLPVQCSQRAYSVFNVTRVVDALREDESTIQRFSTGRVMSIDRYSFDVERVANLQIFKIPQLRQASLFVTDDFVASAKAAGLTGFRFDPVWGN